MKFIKLHQKANNKETFVNPDKIIALFEPANDEKGYVIDFGFRDCYLLVKETPQEIIALINVSEVEK